MMFQKNCAVKQSVRQKDFVCGIKRAMAEKIYPFEKTTDLTREYEINLMQNPAKETLDGVTATGRFAI